MIRRIILFVGLLFGAFFEYRRYNQSSADQLLYTIKRLNLNTTNTKNYTTTIDDKIIIPDTKITTTTHPLS